MKVATKKAPNPVDKHVGLRIRMQRNMIGLSQEKLGDALDLTFQQVQKYEKGTNRVGASRLQQIANILKVTPAFFFDGVPDLPKLGERADTGFVDDFLADKDGLALAKAFMKVKRPEARRAIVRLAELMEGC